MYCNNLYYYAQSIRNQTFKQNQIQNNNNCPRAFVQFYNVNIKYKFKMITLNGSFVR